MNDAVAVEVETPLQVAVATLLQQSAAVAARLYPGEFRRPITSESLAKAGAHILVARIAGEAVGLCVLFDRGGSEFELKRMIVAAEARGRRVGVALIRGGMARAQQAGVDRIVLEVGVRNVEAQALYRRAGFTARGPFPPYRASPISLFMERRV